MKKFFIATIILFSSFSLSFANGGEGSTSINVPLKVPGVECSDNKNGTYKCESPRSAAGTLKMLGNIIKWFTFLVSVIGVLAITICGILYTMGGADENLKSEAKKWIVQLIFGLIILFSAGYILQLIAPWIYK